MATAKKTATKSTGSKSKVSAKKRVLTRAAGEQCFWVKNGAILADLVELSSALKEMEKEVFAHHVRKTQNDFADWIQYVLGDTELADMIRKVKTAKSFHTIVVRRLKTYDV